MSRYFRLARTGAKRTDFRLPSVGTGLSTIGQAQHWEDDLSAMKARFDYFGSKGSSGSAPIFVCQSSFVNIRHAAAVANHLRENPASKGQKRRGLARQGMHDSIWSRQSSYVSAASLTRAVHQLANGSARNIEIVNASAACSSLTSPYTLTRGTRSLPRASGQCCPVSPCDRRPAASAMVSWLTLGRSVSRPPAAPNVLVAWRVAVGEMGCRFHSPILAPARSRTGFWKRSRLAGSSHRLAPASSSPNTCLTGWSVVLRQLLALVGMGHCLFFSAPGELQI